MRFYKKNEHLFIEFKCKFCNQDIDITKLVHELCKYGRDDCPQELYAAWKILRLGTNEYCENPEREHRILTTAIEFMKEKKDKKGQKPNGVLSD